MVREPDQSVELSHHHQPARVQVEPKLSSSMVVSHAVLRAGVRALPPTAGSINDQPVQPRQRTPWD